MARLGIADGNSGSSAMDQPQNITEELKYWPDDRLDQALETAIYSENSPTPTEGPLAPGYLVLAEKSRRQDLRARGTGGGEGVPQTTVAEEMLAGGQGMGPGMDPQMGPGMMPPGMPPQGMPPQGMPQEDPMQFLTSLQGGPQGMPPGMPPGMPQGMPPQGMPMGPMMANTGGLIQRYADGGLTSLPYEEEDADRMALQNAGVPPEVIQGMTREQVRQAIGTMPEPPPGVNPGPGNPMGRPEMRPGIINQIDEQAQSMAGATLDRNASAIQNMLPSDMPETYNYVNDLVAGTSLAGGPMGGAGVVDGVDPGIDMGPGLVNQVDQGILAAGKDFVDSGFVPGSRRTGIQVAKDYGYPYGVPEKPGRRPSTYDFIEDVPAQNVPSAVAIASNQQGPMSGGNKNLEEFFDTIPTTPDIDTVSQVVPNTLPVGLSQGLPSDMSYGYSEDMNDMRSRMNELGSAGAEESAALREQIANMSMMSAPKQQNYMDPARLAFASGLMGGRTVGEGISAGLKASSPFMQRGIEQRNRDREIGNRQQLQNLTAQYDISSGQRGQEMRALSDQLSSLERGADRDLRIQQFGIEQLNRFKMQTNDNDQRALDREFRKNQEAQRIAASLEELGINVTARHSQFLMAELIDASQSVMESPIYQQLVMASQDPSASEKERENARQSAADMLNDASENVETKFAQMYGGKQVNRSSDLRSS